MSKARDPDFRPRNGHTLNATVVARISGGPNQKELSLDDQVDHARDVIAEEYPGIPAEFNVVATTGKGERLDRPELAEIEAMLRSRLPDVLVAEDLGRWVRSADAVRLCGIAVDHKVRVLAPNDSIDTDEETWEEDAISACRDHVVHNVHTSKRLKQKLMNRFLKFGGATPREIYGYFKPKGAKTYDEWTVLPEAVLIYQEWAKRLALALNCSAVADWLNEKKVPTGKYCWKKKKWDGEMVRRVTANPVLIGRPGRGFRVMIKHHETGHRVSVVNPKGPKYRDHPHLAVWDLETFVGLNEALDLANAGKGRKKVDGADPRQGLSRKRTRFPGQHARCWYCGRECVWGGNGVTANLMCGGSRQWRCWHSIGFDGAAVATGIADAITAELYRLEGLDGQLRELVERAIQEGDPGPKRRMADLERAEAKHEVETANVKASMKAFGPLASIGEELRELEVTGARLARERTDLERCQRRAPELPGTVAALRGLVEEKFRGLAIDSAEFGEQMRSVAPEIHVYAVRLLDGGHLLPRARVVLSLSGVVADAAASAGFEELLTSVLTLDLFEPPQREQIRVDAVKLMADGMTQRQAAAELEVTQPAVTAALKLDRLMRERGLDSPYVMLEEPPSDYPKQRRHLNPKYRFEALEGYQRPPL